MVRHGQAKNHAGLGSTPSRTLRFTWDPLPTSCRPDRSAGLSAPGRALRTMLLYVFPLIMCGLIFKFVPHHQAPLQAIVRNSDPPQRFLNLLSFFDLMGNFYFRIRGIQPSGVRATIIRRSLPLTWEASTAQGAADHSCCVSPGSSC